MSNIESGAGDDLSLPAQDKGSPQEPTATQEPAAGRTVRPTYAAAFQCIGSSCEDTCCRGWPIPLDKATYQQYEQFPPEKLGSLVSRYVSIQTKADAPNSLFAHIAQTPSGFCPFFASDRLCEIQKEYGSQLLSTTCSTYPRALNNVHGVLEGSLILSCPEAARNVLLVPDFMQVAGDLFSGEFRTDNVLSLTKHGSGSIHKPYGSFHAVRALLIDTVKDRSRPMWQRLLLIGSLCKSLDEVTTPEGDATVPAILADHRLALENDRLRSELESLPAQITLKLSVILRLTDERVRDKTTGKRFQDTFWAFVEGIGSSTSATPGEDVQRYQEAEEKYYRPFFEKSPFILENYVLNYIFQNLFPFGRENNVRYAPRRIFHEYVLMATQFAWIDTLLVGVAARHKEGFAEEHIVHVIQSFCREVEHNPYVLTSIHELMTHLQLDSLQGMACMLKN